MILTIDFDKIFKHAIAAGAHESDYSFLFWEAFNDLYPAVTQKYADLLEGICMGDNQNESI